MSLLQAKQPISTKSVWMATRRFLSVLHRITSVRTRDSYLQRHVTPFSPTHSAISANGFVSMRMDLVMTTPVRVSMSHARTILSVIRLFLRVIGV